MKLIKIILLIVFFVQCFSDVQTQFTNNAPSNNNSTTNKPEQEKTKNKANKPNSDSQNLVTLNFENADLQTVVKAISEISGKNYVISNSVNKGNITIISKNPIKKSDAPQVLASALRMQGFATVEANGVIKVLPESEVKTYGMKVLTPHASSSGDQFITKIFVINKLPANQIANSIKPMISNSSIMATYGPANCLIISDYQSNLRKIENIINALVSASIEPLQPKLIYLKNILASDAIQTLQPYLSGNSVGNSNNSIAIGGGVGSNSSEGVSINIIPDNNRNCLIISSSSSSKIKEIENIIQLIDKKPNSDDNYHIVYLRNADAAHIADVLRTVAYNNEDPDLQSTNSNRYLTDSTSMFQSIGGSAGSTASPFSSTSKSNGHEGSKSSNGSHGNQDKNAPKIFIQSEPTINALIIEAPDNIYRRLHHIIDLLDVRRAQIMIEALIVDVNVTDAGSFGIQWAAVGPGAAGIASYAASDGAGGAGGAKTIGSTLLGLGAAQKGDLKNIADLDNNVYVGLVSGQTTIGGKKIPSVAALADLLATNAQNNILARPTIITLDNEEANLMVGNNIGVPNGSFQSSANANGALNTTYSRVDLGTSLKIKPLIIEEGTIMLSIFQEDSKVTNYNPGSQAGPTFAKRNLKTDILLSDGQLIAIGGMLSDENNIVKQGIPGLMDIPYLGWLFSWQARKHEKKSMFVFLRPVIVRNSYGVQALTNEKYHYILGQEQEVHQEGNLMLPRIESVTMDNQVPWANNTPPDHQSRQQYFKQAVANDNTGLIDLRNIPQYPQQQNKNNIENHSNVLQQNTNTKNIHDIFTYNPYQHKH